MVFEQYVSFETAKLLQEKGFDAECHAFYKEYKIFYYNHYHDFDRKDIIEAPTQSMAMRWLREVHNIDVWIHPVRRDTKLYEASIIKNLELPFRSLSFELTYEQACEAAIKYCLENLI